MNYNDLKPGDVMFYGRYYWLVVCKRKSSDRCITLTFVYCWGDEIEIYDHHTNGSTQLPKSCEVIRNALQGSETG
jgi:hypothetical protein